MRRRGFIALLGGAAAWPVAARAQQMVGRKGNMPYLGILMPGPAAHSAATLDPFYAGLHELGYVEGQNLAIERRDGDWKPDRLPALATELVHPDCRSGHGRPCGRRVGHELGTTGR